MRLKNIFGASRYIIGLAVIGAFVGSAILLVIAAITLFSIAWNEIVDFDPDNLGGVHLDSLAVELIEITDIILLGTVLYIVALGLYQLFIDRNLPLPHWLKVNDLTDLKRDLIGVVVVLLGVSFLGEVVNWEGESNVLSLGAAVALVIAALGFILWLTPKRHE
ncbi:MAG TPA: YqhA family protein [Thermomicrobiales bacterium]|nr:YqhA family protein [Thermomicrobiales bacterium]